MAKDSHYIFTPHAVEQLKEYHKQVSLLINSIRTIEDIIQPESAKKYIKERIKKIEEIVEKE